MSDREVGVEKKRGSVSGDAAVWPAAILQDHDLIVSGRRLSVRLEAVVWDALEAVATREGLTLSALVTAVEGRIGRNADVPLAAALRLFVMEYLRAAESDAGHRAAGHGQGDPFRGTSFARPVP